MNSFFKYFLHYIFCAAVFFVLISAGKLPDYFYQYLLFPYAKFVMIFYNLPEMSYAANVGYCFEGNNFVIAKECMGYNFIAILFLITTLPFIRKFNSLPAVCFISVCLCGSLAVGFIINCCRIIISIPYINHIKFNIIHLAVGVTLNLTTMTVFYNLINKFLTERMKINEKAY